MDFARVEVSADGHIRGEPTGLAVPKGTRMLVLDIRVTGDRAHLLLHTAEPLPAASRPTPVYGCTEFVFQLPESVLQGRDPGPLLQVIERSLKWSAEQRVCARDDSQLCLEP